MPVTVDAVGPSGGGGAHTATSPLTWTHPGGASPTEILVGVTVDDHTDGSDTVSVTYGGTAMTSVLRWESGGSTQTNGFVQVFKLASPASGNQTVSVTFTGSPDVVTGASMSFNGSSTVSAGSHSDSNNGVATSGSISIPTTSASNLAAAFICDGSGGVAFTAGTSRYIVEPGGAANAGNGAGATIAATGSNVTISWTQTSDFYGCVGVEIQAAAAGPGGTRQPRATVPVPRRKPARAVWRAAAGQAFVQVPAPAQQPMPAPRRKPARAVVRFIPVTTTNAAPVTPPSGTVQPRATVITARRRPSRAFIAPAPPAPPPVPAGTEGGPVYYPYHHRGRGRTR